MAPADPPQRPASAPIGGSAPGGAPVRPVPIQKPPVASAVNVVTPQSVAMQPVMPGPAVIAPAAGARPVPVQPAAVPRAVPTAPVPRPIPIPAGGPSDPSKIVFRNTEQPDDDQLKRVAKNAPPWLISCVVHCLLVVILGLWYLKGNTQHTGIFLDVFADDYGEQLLDSTSVDSIGEIQQEESATIENLTNADPFAAEPAVSTLPLPGDNPLMPSTSSLSELGGRMGDLKPKLLGKYGGNPNSEEAVRLGLEWLSRQQKKDGTWSLKGPYRSGSVGGRDLPESATAMALLAFQGAGNTHLNGEYKKQVAAGIKGLLKMQGSDGNFFQEGNNSNYWFYAHGQCTIAVCELYGMTKDTELKRSAELAVKYCIDSQDADLGGWRYLPRSDSDTSVTGWIVMALQSARMAGLEVPSPVWLKVSEFLDKVTPDGSRYGYQIGSEPTQAMTAEALLCRQYLGWKRDDPRLVQGVELLTQNLPRYDDRDVYYWYYGTQVMHHMEGKYWAAWNGVLRDLLVKNQETSGLEKGSWDPLGEHPDKWVNLGQGGRLYVTCLSLYVLEVYYRHLPIYGVKR
jgi:hypothetical protein